MGGLKNKKIALLGGDERELVLLNYLLEQGVKVQAVGQPPIQKQVEVVTCINDLDQDLEAVIAPMTGVNDKQVIKKTFANQKVRLTESFFKQLKPGTQFFIGFASAKIKEWCQDHKLDLIELAALDELAILNAVPTAEGAIQLAMQKSDITLSGNNAFVLGLGRVGLTLARRLKGLGSNTYGVARKPKDRARAQEIGFYPVEFANLKSEINKADFIFNTVPAVVLTESILKAVDPEALVIDLASAPGGTDFKAAEKLGIEAELALGLPGKVAPESAGQILTKIVSKYLRRD